MPAAVDYCGDVVPVQINGADVNARNETGGTPLHDAALGGQAAVVELLLGRGAGLNVPDTLRSPRRYKPHCRLWTSI